MARADGRRSYEDFEPFCKWKRNEGEDILEVHLIGFKKDQLRVQLNNLGTLTIYGERPLEEGKWIRFRKETEVAKDCNSDRVRAKMSGGILSVFMPKKSPLPPAENQPKSEPQQGNKTRSDVPEKIETGNQEMGSSENATIANKPTAGYAIWLRDLPMMLKKMDKKTAIKVVAVLLLLALAVFGALLIHKYRNPAMRV